MNIDQTKLVYSFCDNLFNILEEENKGEYVKEFNDNLLAINEVVSISIGDAVYKGVLLGIREDGALMINEDNNVLTINDIDSTLRLI